MKTNFKPNFYRQGDADPRSGGGIGSLIGSIGGGTPYGAIAQTVIGGAQAIGGAIREHKANKELNKLIASYQPNRSIMDYYNKALQKYNTNPYTSQLYNSTVAKVGASTAQGINAFQDRRSANANISTLIQNQNDTLLKAGIAAEDQSNQALGRLGQATAMKAHEEKYPFELKYNQLSSKAGGGAQIMNAGLSNIFGGTQSLSERDLLKKYYSQ